MPNLALNKLDWTCFVAIVILVAIGGLMMFSTSSVVGLSNFGDGYYFIKRYFVYLFLGSIAFSFGLIVPISRYKQYFLWGYGISVVLLLLSFVPGIGVFIGGARRWVNLGVIQLQPVEVAKFWIIVMLAATLENKEKVLYNFFNGLVPVLMLLGVPILILAKQPDLSNTLVLMATAFLMFFLNPVPLRFLTMLIGLGMSMVITSIFVNPYQMERIKTFLSPERDPYGRSYHILQSLIAVGSGGFMGLGLGQSKLKFFYLPLHYSDFIFAIICEEGGFILASTVILCFAVLLTRGLRIGFQAPDSFAKNLAFGLTFLLVIQAMLNIGVVMAVFPVTGITLTYISFGGTSLVMSLFFSGVLLNISMKRQVR